MPYLVEPVIAAGTMANASQPTLRLDVELTLRPFVSADAPAVLRAYNVPDIQRWHYLRIDSLDEAEQWIGRTGELWREEKSAIFAVADGTDALLGRCALHVDLRRGTAEISYWMLPEARGRGATVAAATAVTEWGHENLGVQRILLQHAVANAASCAVANRVGYSAEGTARLQTLHADGWHDMHQHAHLASDPPSITTGGRGRPSG